MSTDLPKPVSQYWFKKANALIDRIEAGQKRAEFRQWLFDRIEQLAAAGFTMKEAERVSYDELSALIFGTRQ